MKRLMKRLMQTLLLVALALLVSACAKWEPPYASLDEDGYRVSVRFDANGGMFAGTNNVYVVDVFSLENKTPNANGLVELALLEPNDAHRKDTAFEVTKTGYYLAGWYTERALRVSEDGQPLDENGELTATSGKPQGYVYSGRWDFATDRLEVDPNGSYTSEENVLTLYAAWVPYFTFDVYEVKDGEAPTLIDSVQTLSLDVPSWNEKTGEMNMKKFPKLSGKTFEAAYMDADLQTPIESSLAGGIDYERGIATTSKIAVYTTWMDGTWLRITQAEQIYKHASLSGNYILAADLDFANEIWPMALTKGEFKGTILGNGHTISNVSVKQGDISQITGGLFGSLGSAAVLDDVRFENITYTMEKGSRIEGDSFFGLLAGKIAAEATLNQVSITGTLRIDADIYPNSHYLIGLLAGSGAREDMDLSGITCEAINNDPEKLQITVENGLVTVDFGS